MQSAMCPNKYNKSLSLYTTFRIGGPARILTCVPSPEDVVRAIDGAKGMGIPWRVIGGGSNILAADEGYDGVVVVFRGEELPVINADGTVTVCAGSRLSALVGFLADNGLGGLETLAGIPGTVGGAIAGNAGAYGNTIGRVVENVEILGTEGAIKNVCAGDLEFGYRTSRIKRTGEVILKATFRPHPTRPSHLKAEIEKCLADRCRKHPDHTKIPTAGSYFKNPLDKTGKRIAAGRLLEEAGCKDIRVGSAHPWHMHAGIIVHDGSAKAADIIALAKLMSDRVEEKFGISLEREVVYLSPVSSL